MKKNFKKYIGSFLVLAFMLSILNVRAEENYIHPSQVYHVGDRPITVASPMGDVAIYTGQGITQLNHSVVPGELSVGEVKQKGDEIQANSDYGGNSYCIKGVSLGNRKSPGILTVLYTMILYGKNEFIESYLMECDSVVPKGTELEYLELNYLLDWKEGAPSEATVVYEFKDPIAFDTKIIVPNRSKKVTAIWMDKEGNHQENTLSLEPTVENPKPTSRWLKEEGIWYYYDEVGNRMENSWFYYNQQWYYLGEDGKMKTGWFQDKDERWYYLRTSSNVPQSGSEGAMCKGWIKIAQYWYYLRPEGNVPNEGPSGSMLQNTSAVLGNKTYHFDGSGHCINP